MPVIAVCHKCKARIKAPEALLGQTVKCPGCTAAFVVQSLATTPPPATVKAPVSALRKSPPPAPPPPIIDRLPEVEDEEEEVVDVLAAEDDVEEIDVVEEDDHRISTAPRSRRWEDEEDGESREKQKAKRKKDRERDRRDNEKMMAMLVHLLGLFTGFIGPLILWLIKKDESRFVDHHGRTHLNFAVNMFVWSMGICVFGFSAGCVFGFARLPWLILIVYIFTILALMGLSIYSLVLVITAAIKAKNGLWYELPVSFAPFGRSSRIGGDY